MLTKGIIKNVFLLINLNKTRRLRNCSSNDDKIGHLDVERNKCAFTINIRMHMKVKYIFATSGKVSDSYH
jgi:hypothetical protein